MIKQDFAINYLPEELYQLKNAYLEQVLDKVTPLEFFNDNFTRNDKFIGQSSRADVGYGNPLLRVDRKGTQKFYNKLFKKYHYERIDNTFKYHTDKCAEAFLLYNLNTFYGKSPSTSRIDRVYGLILDIDNLNNLDEFSKLLYAVDKQRIPTPNYVINSGNGIHLIYQFLEPIRIRWGKTQLIEKKILGAMYDIVWNELGRIGADGKNKYSNDKKLSLSQGFRSPYCLTKAGFPVTTWTTRQDKYLVADFVSMIQADSRVLPADRIDNYEVKFLLTDIEGSTGKKRYIKTDKPVEIAEIGYLNPKTYHDFVYRCLNEFEYTEGTRYFTLNAIVTLGLKCKIDPQKVEDDVVEVYNHIVNQTSTNSFEDFVLDAVLYHAKHETVNTRNKRIKQTRKTLYKQIGQTAPPTAIKRNGRKQSVHLAKARNRRKSNTYKYSERPTRKLQFTDLEVKICDLYEQKFTQAEIAHRVGVSVGKVNKVLKIYRTDKEETFKQATETFAIYVKDYGYIPNEKQFIRFFFELYGKRIPRKWYIKNVYKLVQEAEKIADEWTLRDLSQLPFIVNVYNRYSRRRFYYLMRFLGVKSSELNVYHILEETARDIMEHRDSSYKVRLHKLKFFEYLLTENYELIESHKALMSDNPSKREFFRKLGDTSIKNAEKLWNQRRRKCLYETN